MNAMSFAIRTLTRDWRAGELPLLAVAVAVAVTSVTAVAFFTNRVERVMQGQAAELLAADLVVVSSSPIRQALIAEAVRQGLEHSITVDFPSVILAGEDTLLVQVKAVDEAYPLRGQLKVAQQSRGPATATHDIPAQGHAWVETRLLDQLRLRPGEQIQLGERAFTIHRVLDYEPDRAGQLFRLAPRVMIRGDDLEATRLVTPNSRVRYRLLVAGPEATVEAYRSWLDESLIAGEELRGIRDGRPEIRMSLERAEQYLALAALVAVIVAGAAIALTTRHYAERQLDTAAILRCLGAKQNLILQVYVYRFFIVGLAASVAGCALGFGAHMLLMSLLHGWFVSAPPLPGLSPVATGLVTGTVAIMGFGLPPLLRLREVPPLRVLRRDLGTAPPSMWLTGIFAALAMLLILVWQLGANGMTSRMLVGAAVAIAILWLISALMVMAARKVMPQSGTAWRYALMRLCRQSGHSVLQVAGFTVGIAALLVLVVVRVDLLDLWRHSLPADAPNHFLINIQQDDLKTLNTLARQHGLTMPPYYPLVRGRLVGINDQDVTSEDYGSLRAKRLINREFNLTWTNQLQSDNEIVSGQWWGESGQSVSAFSVEEDIADPLGITLNDLLRFQIAGTEISAKVTSIRAVDWETFNPNFFVIGSSRLLSELPANYITSFYLQADQRALISELVRELPSVTVLNIDTIMRQVRAIMDRAASAIEYVFLFTVAASLVVMYAAIQASHAERRHEIALIRALGGSRKQVLAGLLAEFAGLGVMAGVLGALVAGVVGYLVAVHVFDLIYRPSPWLWILGIVCGGVGIAVAGLLGTKKLLNQSPLHMLHRT